MGFGIVFSRRQAGLALSAHRVGAHGCRYTTTTPGSPLLGVLLSELIVGLGTLNTFVL